MDHIIDSLRIVEQESNQLEQISQEIFHTNSGMNPLVSDSIPHQEQLVLVELAQKEEQVSFSSSSFY
jgi:hypothetical protein